MPTKPAMSPSNSDVFTNASIVHPDFFFISGLVGIPHSKYYYIFLCFVYAVTVLGNTFVMLVIYTDHGLHTPKYTVVFNLAVSDLCVSTSLVPQMIDTHLFKSQLISYEACLTSMFFYSAFVTMQSLTLTVLSYDRYVAICFPLRYDELTKSMSVISVILWIFAGMANLLSVVSVNSLSFCKSIVVNSYFCENGSIQLLACNDYTPSAVIRWISPIVILWFPASFIMGTYICIARALLRIAAVSERLKAMKTCTSHLILVSMFYFPIVLSAALGPSIHQNARIINLSLATVMPPMLNPIIYSLKTEEFTESIKKLYRRKRTHITARKKFIRFNHK